VDYGVFSASCVDATLEGAFRGLTSSYRATPCILHTFDRVLRTISVATRQLQSVGFIPVSGGEEKENGGVENEVPNQTFIIVAFSATEANSDHRRSRRFAS
jgi:hypothetical protein